MNPTISCAESLTGGHLQTLFTQYSGASDFFVGGITCYNIDQKVKHLGVDRAYAASCNCVSERTATEMAIGCQKLFGSSVACATTGYAGVYPEAGVTVPFAWYAIADNQGHILECKKIEGPSLDRIGMQTMVAQVVYKKAQEIMNP